VVVFRVAHNKWYQSSGFNLEGGGIEDLGKIQSTISCLEVKISSLSQLLIPFLNYLFSLFGGDDEVNQSTVKTAKIYQSKIDVVKFDGTNNFGMWRCEMIDALNA